MGNVRTVVCLVVLAAAALFCPADVAHADSGLYTDSYGLSCSWYRYTDSMYDTNCSGFSSQLGGYYRYSCDVVVYTSTSSSWTCRDMNSNHWSGSR